MKVIKKNVCSIFIISIKFTSAYDDILHIEDA